MALQTKKADLEENLSDQSLLVQDANIWTGRHFRKGSILIENGKIRHIARTVKTQADEKLKASGLYALPGLIDIHVHLRDMKLSYKEDFATGTAAAAAGGFTTVLDMPNTLPPTDTPKRLLEKQRKASRRVHVNAGFHAAASSDPIIIEGLARAGAFSLKLYMPKPIAPLDMTDNHVVQEMMSNARKVALPITVHGEDLASTQTGGSESFVQLAENRPPLMETRAVEKIIRAQEATGCRIHFCHVTLASNLSKIARHSRITSEVTPHHLLLSKGILRRKGGNAWMVPPLRSSTEQEALLAAVSSGTCDAIASDHAPHSIREKQESPGKCPPGIPGLETTLPLMLTMVNKGIMRFSSLVDLLAIGPARIFGLKSKGRIRCGYDADLVLVDPRRKTRVNSDRFFSKAKYSPFDGFQTRGAVVSTVVRGAIVYHEGDLVGKEGWGSVLRSKTFR